MRRAGFRNGLRDRPHASNGVPPYAFFAVHLAEAVVEQDITRARRVGARICPDNAVEAENGLDRRAFNHPSRKSPAEAVKRSRKSRWSSRPSARILLPRAAGLEQFADRGERFFFDDVRRGFEHGVAQDVGHRLQACLIFVEARRVPR